jgi:hypothetical protein
MFVRSREDKGELLQIHGLTISQIFAVGRPFGFEIAATI